MKIFCEKIRKIFQNSLNLCYFRAKVIDKDDEVLAINGIILRGLQLEDALRHLRCSDRVVQIIVAKQKPVIILIFLIIQYFLYL
jgi:hypothetical protein